MHRRGSTPTGCPQADGPRQGSCDNARSLSTMPCACPVDNKALRIDRKDKGGVGSAQPHLSAYPQRKAMGETCSTIQSRLPTGSIWVESEKMGHAELFLIRANKSRRPGM